MKTKVLKKAVAIFLTLIMLLSTIPLSTASADEIIEGTTEDGFVYSIENEEVTIIGYTGLDTELIIPKQIDDFPVTNIDVFFYIWCENITSIAIPESVTSISSGSFMFSSYLTEIIVDENNNTYTSEDGILFSKDMTQLIACPEGKKLSDYTIPDGVEIIYGNAFDSNISLSSIIIPESVWSIGSEAFLFCTNLVNIDVNENNDYYTSVDGVLFSKDMLTLCVYPQGKTYDNYSIPEGVKNLDGYSFYWNESLKSVIIPDGMENINRRAFSMCKNLSDVSLPDSVTYIGESAFYSCENFKNIVLPENLTYIDDATFKDCINLENITIPESVTHIGSQAFEYCESLKQITIPESVVEIEWDCFREVSEDFIMYVYEGSAAETYAKENNINFAYVDSTPTSPSTSVTEPTTATVSVSTTPTESEVTKTTEPSPTAPDTGDYEMGDVNMDGKLNIRDATLIQKVAAKMETLDDIQSLLADYNSDGKVNVKDATAIQKFIAGIK